MENGAKALIMASGILLAVMVVTLVMYGYQKMGEWTKSQEDEVLIRQAQLFNKEFEAYDKDLMYGVDIISCLNKAKSNNDKITNKYGEDYDERYEIKIRVKFEKGLGESLAVYYIGSGGEFEYTEGNGADTVTLDAAKFSVFSTRYSGLTLFRPASDKLFTTTHEDIFLAGTYELTKDSTSTEPIVQLIDASAFISETVKNDNVLTQGLWSRAVFKPAIYDLKTKKFKCIDMTYNSDTGRIDYMSFTEFV